MSGVDFRALLYESYVSTHVVPTPSGTEHRSFGHDRWWRAKIIPHLSDLDRTLPILELGAGSGEFLDFLQRCGFKNVIGLDISSEQVEIAQDGGRPVIHGDAFDFLGDSTTLYGGIVCFDFLEHLTRDELVAIVPLIAERLSPGGRLIVQTVNGAGLFPFQVAFGDLTHMTILTEGSLTQLLRWGGMINIRMFETGPAATGWRGFLRLALWRVFRGVAWFVRFVETGKRQAIWTENLICIAERSRSQKE